MPKRVSWSSRPPACTNVAGILSRLGYSWVKTKLLRCYFCVTRNVKAQFGDGRLNYLNSNCNLGKATVPELFAGGCRSSFGRSFFLSSSSCEHVLHAVVSFITGVLKYGPGGLGGRHFCFPRLGPRVRVVNREFVPHRFLAGASQAFGQFKIPACSLEGNFVVKVRGFDNESVPLPVSARIAQP